MRNCGIHMVSSGNRIWCSWFSEWKLPFQGYTMVYPILYSHFSDIRTSHGISWKKPFHRGLVPPSRVAFAAFCTSQRHDLLYQWPKNRSLSSLASTHSSLVSQFFGFIVLVIWPCLTNTFIGQTDVKLCVSLCFCIVFDQFSWSPFSSYFILSFTIIPIYWLVYLSTYRGFEHCS